MSESVRSLAAGIVYAYDEGKQIELRSLLFEFSELLARMGIGRTGVRGMPDWSTEPCESSWSTDAEGYVVAPLVNEGTL